LFLKLKKLNILNNVCFFFILSHRAFVIMNVKNDKEENLLPEKLLIDLN